MPAQHIVFGFGSHTGIDHGPALLRMAQQADDDRLDIFSLSDHPYGGGRLDAYASIGFILGRTQQISGLANVTNLPARPAPMLARTVTTLSALSGGRIVLGLGAGGLWERIADMGVPRLSPSDAVNAFEEDWRSERYRTSRQIIDRAAEEVGRDPREIRQANFIFDLYKSVAILWPSRGRSSDGDRRTRPAPSAAASGGGRHLAGTRSSVLELALGCAGRGARARQAGAP